MSLIQTTSFCNIIWICLHIVKMFVYFDQRIKLHQTMLIYSPFLFIVILPPVYYDPLLILCSCLNRDLDQVTERFQKTSIKTAIFFINQHLDIIIKQVNWSKKWFDPNLNWLLGHLDDFIDKNVHFIIWFTILFHPQHQWNLQQKESLKFERLTGNMYWSLTFIWVFDNQKPILSTCSIHPLILNKKSFIVSAWKQLFR